MRAETDKQRESGAVVGEADVAELRARMEAHGATGEVLNERGEVVKTGAATARALFFAQPELSGVFGAFGDWLKGQLL